MKQNTPFIFFTLLALLASNPLMLYLLYGGTAIWQSKVFHLLHAGNLLLLLLLFWGLVKDKLSNRLKNTGFAYGVLLICLAIFVGLDRLAGFVLRSRQGSAPAPGKGIIFDANTKVACITDEFNFTATTNSLGLRDNEVPPKSKALRIMCLGDSWTFGWGVSLEQSWPKVMEQKLRQKGMAVEVINCGKGGAYPAMYREYAEQLIPLLKPDVVVVGLLQMDDLAQAYENQDVPSYVPAGAAPLFKLPKASSFLKDFGLTLAESSVGNLRKLLQGTGGEAVPNMQQHWQTEANDILANLNRFEQLRYHYFPDSLKLLFAKGQLNPGLVNYYIKFAERDRLFNDPAQQAPHRAAQLVKADMEAIAQVARQHGAKLMLANMPNNVFVGHQMVRPSMYQEGQPVLSDSIYNALATQNGLLYADVATHFRALPNKSKYFFRYDGHPNIVGYQEIGDYMAATALNQNLFKR